MEKEMMLKRLNQLNFVLDEIDAKEMEIEKIYLSGVIKKPEPVERIIESLHSLYIKTLTEIIMLENELEGEI